VPSNISTNSTSNANRGNASTSVTSVTSVNQSSVTAASNLSPGGASTTVSSATPPGQTSLSASTTITNEHNNLVGLQGGSAGEYYHLTSSEYIEISNWLDSVVLNTNGSVNLGSGNLETTGDIRFNPTGTISVEGDGNDLVFEDVEAGRVTLSQLVFPNPSDIGIIEEHNNLFSLQGGIDSEYYHLTESEHSELTGWLDNVTLDVNGDILLTADNQKITFGTNQDASIYFDIDTGLNIDIDNPSDIGPRIKLNDDVDIAGKLITTGTITGEQLTSTDNITMAGLFTNNLGASDATGFDINQTYTGSSSNTVIDIDKSVTGSGSGISTYGVDTYILDEYQVTGSPFGTSQYQKAFINYIKIDADHDATVGVGGYTDTCIVFDNEAELRGNLSITSSGSLGFVTVGSENEINDWRVWSSTDSGTFTNVGIRAISRFLGSESTGTLTVNTTGIEVTATAGSTGNSTGIGVKILAASGDIAYGIWDESGADWGLDSNNQAILLGESQDASIEYDTTDGLIIKPDLISTLPVTMTCDSTHSNNPLLVLDQNDEDAPFISFAGTIGSDASKNISTLTTSGSTTHHIKLAIDGTEVWIAASTTDPSS